MSASGKVVVALSGGVDSAVACAELKSAGHEVLAVFVRMTAPDQPARSSVKGHLADVQRIAKLLDVELHVVDYSWDLSQIIEYFKYEYAHGRTPNPCAKCNAVLKFGRLLAFSRQLGAAWLATGHYARMVDVEGHWRLGRGRAVEKDQSYVLFGIRRADLPSIRLPNGEMASKDAVRQRARELDLPVHDKEDSQEICFVPNDDYAAFLARYQTELNQPGPIVDMEGRVIGEHEGVFRYTIGQRRGLKVAAGEPIYVVRIDPLTNTVVTGPREALAATHLVARDLNWHIDPAQLPSRALAQIRSTHKAAPAGLELIGADRLRVTFDQPQFAVTPGQAVVLYQDDLVLGGGWIRTDE
ncbi:MAG: tRNA 2-thiouridine(34) synthase MnmA [Phycisphaerae bacterium]|nr:tRNA 2-thiouridine(34) synthase MnmA [Phycisphaerae bacterium]